MAAYIPYYVAVLVSHRSALVRPISRKENTALIVSHFRHSQVEILQDTPMTRFTTTIIRFAYVFQVIDLRLECVLTLISIIPTSMDYRSDS